MIISITKRPQTTSATARRKAAGERKEVKRLKITIKGKPKEIATLVVGLQGWQAQIQPLSSEDCEKLKAILLVHLETKDLDRRVF